eukprot:scaffold61922_cov30-Phaeocystis_antarctica.AAC.1
MYVWLAAFQAPLGHLGPSCSCPGHEPQAHGATRAPRRPPDQLGRCAAGASRQLSWRLGPPARARAEASGGDRGGSEKPRRR